MVLFNPSKKKKKKKKRLPEINMVESEKLVKQKKKKPFTQALYPLFTVLSKESKQISTS